MKIATYILNSSIKTDSIPSVYEIKNDITTLNDSFFLNLKKSLLDIINSEDDVICFICEPDGIINLDLHVLEEVIVDLIQENIMSFYLKASFKNHITFSKYYQVISEIENVSTFILTRPLFQYALSLFNKGWNEKNEKLQFFKLLFPHSVLVNFAINYIINENILLHIISPFRNADRYIEECWNSLDRQIFQNFKLYLIDDFSDNEVLHLIPNRGNIYKLRNEKRLYALQNIINVLINNTFKESDVICILDGDDMLPHKYVLNILSEIYQNDSIEFTYGSMNYFNSYSKSFGMAYTEKEFGNIRKCPWKVAPFRTFKYKLFKRLLKADPEFISLKDSYLNFYSMPADMALCFSLLELTNYKKVKFVPTPMYQYRLHNSNDMYINRKKQYEGEIEVRSKPPLNLY